MSRYSRRAGPRPLRRRRRGTKRERDTECKTDATRQTSATVRVGNEPSSASPSRRNGRGISGRGFVRGVTHGGGGGAGGGCLLVVGLLAVARARAAAIVRTTHIRTGVGRERAAAARSCRRRGGSVGGPGAGLRGHSCAAVLGEERVGRQTRGDAPSFSASSSSPPSSSSSSFDGSMRSPSSRSSVEAQVEDVEPAGWGVEGGCARAPRAGGGGALPRRRRGSRSSPPPPPPPPPAGSTRSMARSPEDGEGGAVGSRRGLRRAGREGRPRERAPRSARRSSDAETRRVTATVLRRGIRARGGGASRSVISALAASTPAEPTARAAEANNDRVEEKFTTSRASFF